MKPVWSWLAWLLVDLGIFLVGILVGVLFVGTICEGAEPSNLSHSSSVPLTLGEARWTQAMRDAKICMLTFLADGSGMRATLATTDQGCAGPTEESPVVGWETMYRVMKGEAIANDDLERMRRRILREALRDEIPFPDCPYDAPPGVIPYVCVWKPSTRSIP